MILDNTWQINNQMSNSHNIEINYDKKNIINIKENNSDNIIIENTMNSKNNLMNFLSNILFSEPFL